MPIRCLIVDDNSSFRQEMGGLLEEQGLEVVGGAASAAEALQQIAELIERSSALGFLPKTELSGAAIRRMLASATSETSRSGERRGT